jgi:hypothetical protein
MIDFLPYTSDNAPITGLAINCRNENNDPIKPSKQ